MIEHSEELESFFEKLSSEEWPRLMYAFGELHQFVASRKKGGKKIDAQSVKFRSNRFAYAMAWKEPQTFAKKVFLNNFRHYSDELKYTPVEIFRQRQAIACAISNDVPWMEALEILRSTRSGVGFVYFESELPEQIREIVINNPKDYPVVIWDKAQSDIASSLAKEIKSVASIAKKEKWFTR